jgi:hypothetical protein
VAGFSIGSFLFIMNLISASRLLFNPLQHNIKGKPDVPDLAVVLSLFFPREDPGCGSRLP